MHSLARLSGPLLLAVVVGCVSLGRSKDVGEGQLAPPIDGLSGNGQRLHLNDYSGKIVLLCFGHGN
jgi:hypothetical protein